MALIVLATDLRDDPFVTAELPKALSAAGHSLNTTHPLEKLVEAARFNGIGCGGFDLGVLVHSTSHGKGVDSPYRVATMLRSLPDTLSFKNAVKAKSLPVLVVARKEDLGNVESDKLKAVEWVSVFDPESKGSTVATAVQDVIFRWRTSLLDDLESAGYAVTIEPGGRLNVRPAFVKAHVEGEILSPGTSLGALSAAGYLVLSSDYFQLASSYRQFAYLIENFRVIAAAKKTKPEEVFQEFFTKHPDLLFRMDFARIWPKPRFHLPENPVKRLEPDFVVKPSVIPQLGSKWTVLDLKLPDVKLVKSRRFHPTFSAKLDDALQQLADYHHFFGREDAKEQLEAKFGFHPRNPKLAVLIGRRPTVDVASILDHVGNTMPRISVEIITYDEVLDWRSQQIANELDWLKRFK